MIFVVQIVLWGLAMAFGVGCLIMGNSKRKACGFIPIGLGTVALFFPASLISPESGATGFHEFAHLSIIFVLHFAGAAVGFVFYSHAKNDRMNRVLAD